MNEKPIPLLRDHIITLSIYVGLALITQSLFKTITVWPSAGAALAAFLVFGLRIWPSVALGTFVGVLAYFVEIGQAPFSPAHMIINLATVLGNTIAAVMALLVCGRVGSMNTTFACLKWIIRKFLPAIFLFGILSAVPGVGVYWIVGSPWDIGYISGVTAWTISNIVGAIVLAPMLINCWQKGEYRRLSQIRKDHVVAIFVLLGLAFVIFGPGMSLLPSLWLQPSFLLIPLVVAAISFSQSFTYFLVALTFFAVWLGTNAGYGPFFSGNEAVSHASMQAFIGFSAVVILIMQALIAEQRLLREKWAEELQENNRQLEKKVKERTDAFRESEEKFRYMTENSSDVIWHLDRNYVFTYISPADERLRGFKQEEVIGAKVWSIMKPEGIEHVKSVHAKRLAEEKNGIQTGTIRYELEQCRKDGGWIWTEVNVTAQHDKNGELIGLHGVTRDIGARKQVEAALEESNRKLEILSLTDGLTGIANRRHFDAVLAAENSRHCRSGAKLSLIMLDIDFFKAFNDEYGHVKGDECLRLIGQALASCATRPSDLVARYGGEEFACILPETDLNGAVVIAEKIRRGIQALAIPHKGSSVEACVTVSLGLITVRCTEKRTVTDILKQTDELLYRAKAAGRNRLEFAEIHDAGLTVDGKFAGHLVQLVWNEAFCCGNSLIDSQHRALFDASNKLLAAVFSEKSDTDIALIIEDLLAEVSKHFHDEMEILETVDFPGRVKHAAEHEKLRQKACGLSRQFNASTRPVGDILYFLTHDIVMAHMLGADREFTPFVSGKSSS